ncbi:hypothetical protein CR513_11571, partial [Mucuna pruriens]
MTSTPTPIASRTSNIKCFKCLGKGHIASQCPNRRVMIVKDDGEIESESSLGELSSSREVESLSDGSHYKGDLLVVRRLMNSHVSYLDNLCSMIIDGGSCMNVASKRLVKKLALPTFMHQSPYKLQWLSEKGELLVEKQVKVTFTLGWYEYKVTCNMVSMEATHLLLGRPWVRLTFTLGGYEDKVTFNVVSIEVTHLLLRGLDNMIRGEEKVECKTKSKLKKKERERKAKKRKERRKEKVGEKRKSVREKSMQDLLEEFQDVFQKDVPHGLPPLRGVEYHIDLTLGATLPNRAAYRTNPEEAKEIQKQVGKLIEKGRV